MLYQESVNHTHIEAEMELARRVQLRLLPKSPPDVDGLDIGADSCPAWQVGGDFFDFIYRPGRPFIFAVGDVTGKGLSAALLMSMTRTVVRSAAKFTTVLTPKAVMNRSNVDLYDDFTEVGMFATAFIGQYQPQADELSYANAGHSPVIYCPAGGPATLLQADGTAMGVLPFGSWENHALPFRPGDLLVVATDGFSEARDQTGDMFGYDRLLRLIEAVADRSAQKISEQIYDSVRDFAYGQPQDDDQTIVVIKRVTP